MCLAGVGWVGAAQKRLTGCECIALQCSWQPAGGVLYCRDSLGECKSMTAAASAHMIIT
jgi:hypothetical protein